MNERNKNTKEALAESLKKRMIHHSFERITIKEITDGAGFIRSTFYNHFQDKYDLLEWIFCKDVMRPSEPFFAKGEYRQAVQQILSAIEKEKEFYMRAAKIQGQNAFRDIVFHSFCRVLGEVLTAKTPHPDEMPHLFRPEILAEYYANAETFLLMKWLENGVRVSAADVEKAHWFLIAVPFENVVQEISAE